MENKLIRVNTEDNIIGFNEKIEVHISGQLHRAFSIFIWDAESGKMLIQKRAKSKYHSGGLWTNACCSHPRKDEDIQTALIERLKEELGIVIHPSGGIKGVPIVRSSNDNLCTNTFYDCGKFRYLADFGTLIEHEIDRVFLLIVQRSRIEIQINPEEVEEIQWIDEEELYSHISKNPHEFTAWFCPALYLVSLSLDVLPAGKEKYSCILAPSIQEYESEASRWKETLFSLIVGGNTIDIDLFPFNTKWLDGGCDLYVKCSDRKIPIKFLVEGEHTENNDVECLELLSIRQGLDQNPHIKVYKTSSNSYSVVFNLSYSWNPAGGSGDKYVSVLIG